MKNIEKKVSKNKEICDLVFIGAHFHIAFFGLHVIVFAPCPDHNFGLLVARVPAQFFIQDHLSSEEKVRTVGIRRVGVFLEGVIICDVGVFF